MKPISTNLKIKKNEGMSDHAIQFEITKLQKSISSIEANIAKITEEYDKQMSELAEERNYDPWFYAAGALLFVLFLFKLTFSSFLILMLFIGLFVAYKKFLHKEKRVIEIKQDYEQNLKNQENLLVKRHEELEKYF
jgi:Ca2+/Na+ antiporter